MSEDVELDDDARRRFASACAGKEEHVSEAAALASAAMGRSAMHAYLCDFGDHWHLASVPGHRRHASPGDGGRGESFERLRTRSHREAHPRRKQRQ